MEKDKFEKSVELFLKKDTEEKGIIEGQLVTHSVIDSYGDYFDKTALDKVDKDKTYFLLHQHNWEKEIGVLKVHQNSEGHLKFKAQLDLSVDTNNNPINKEAHKVYSMMLKGANYEMSVGGFVKIREWGTIETQKGTVEARIIKEFEVVEGSVVLKGAVPEATVEAVKNNKSEKEKENEMEKNKILELLEKGLKETEEKTKATSEKIENVEKTINETNANIEKMGKSIDELMRKGINQPEIIEKKESEAFEKYLKTGNSADEALRKAPITTSGVTSILMPAVLANEILKETKETSNFLMAGKIVNLKGKSIVIPVRNEITGANEIVTETNGNTKDGALSYKHIEITAGMRQVRYPVTDETKDDTAFDIIQEIKEAIAEEFGQTLSALTLKGQYGTGDNYIQGFLTDTDILAGAVITATTNIVTWEDMVKLETGMKTSYRANAAYYVSPQLYEQMKLWKDNNGVPLWNTIVNGETLKFNGYPVYVEYFLDDVKKDQYPAVFCDFRKGYTYVMKKDFEQELHRDPNTRITTYYTRIRLGGKVTRPKAFSVLKVK